MYVGGLVLRSYVVATVPVRPGNQLGRGESPRQIGLTSRCSIKVCSAAVIVPPVATEIGRAHV